MNANIRITEIPEMNLAYVPTLGPNNLGQAYNRLIQWAISKGVMNGHTKMVTIYHDSFKVTEANKVRMSAAILLNKSIETNEGIVLTSIDPGKYIVGSFEIEIADFEKSWTALFLWMNENGYKKREKEPFEIFHNNFNEHPEKKAIVDFHIPIE